MGTKRAYSDTQLYEVLISQLQEWSTYQLLIKAFGGSIIYIDENDEENNFEPTGDLETPAVFLRRHLVHNMKFYTSNVYSLVNNLPQALSPSRSGNLYLFFDFLEILHELAADPRMTKTKRLTYSRKDGQRLFREAINPDLALYEAPHQMLSNGQIVEISNKPVIELAEQALHVIDIDGIPDSVARPVNNAVTNYIKRGATVDEKKTAVRELADALESIRPSIKTHLLSADEGELFKVANQFAIRHNDSKQKSDYNKSIWYDWMFHVNLAALLTVIKILREQE